MNQGIDTRIYICQDGINQAFFSSICGISLSVVIVTSSPAEFKSAPKELLEAFDVSQPYF